MRTILICVAGTSPAVITETLQALADEDTAVDELHIVTTSIGKDQVLSRLGGDGGPFARLAADYPGDGKTAKIDALLLRPEHVHVIKTDKGEPLADIASEADAARMANLIGELVRQHTAHDDRRVFASLAGGRKTMSFWLGCAMSLFGWPHDRLMHVLVNEPFEGCADFYFKPSKPMKVQVTAAALRPKYGDEIGTERASITLGAVPFPQFRPHLKNTAWLDLKRPLDIGRMIAEVNAAEAGVSLLFDDQALTIRLNDRLSVPFRSVHYYAVYKLCAEVAAGRLPAGAVLAGPEPGLLTMDDFVAGSRWAAARLFNILEALDANGEGEEERLPRGRLWFMLNKWKPEDGALWQEVRQTEQSLSAAEGLIGGADAVKLKMGEQIAELSSRMKEKSLALQVAKTALQEAIHGKTGATGAEKERLEGRVDQKRKAVRNAEAAFAQAESRESNARALLAVFLEDVANAKAALPGLRHLRSSHERNDRVPFVLGTVEAIQGDLAQARARADRTLAREVRDAQLRNKLKLVRSKTPFMIGLQPEFRGPGRIAFKEYKLQA
ncbi:MAG: TIGR02584 family CRISPR-associated protein [Enhydrobacter sp.]|nr:MAG: TIGR02584 family CRISPR-associated protein [Enhydrobacter sp.]